MKKLMIWIVSGVSAIVLSGCGGSGESTAYQTYFITGSDGFGVPGIVYSCDRGTEGTTGSDGAFDFDALGDTCDFYFIPNDITGDLYLESDNDPNTDAGINGVEFDCIEGVATSVSGVTRYDSWYGLNGYIDEVSSYTQCTLYNLP